MLSIYDPINGIMISDYDLACKRIEAIFHSEPGSKEDDELEVLITLINAYEEIHFPIGAPHPIETL